MQYERYETHALDAFLIYEFYSEGPKGRIKKRVEFRPLNWNLDVYNLGFGDVDETDRLNDEVITNNLDRGKVLTTVAFTVMRFFEYFPGKFVFIAANTPSRARLYRIAINNNVSTLEKYVRIFGLVDLQWYPFEPDSNYEAFLIQLKKVIFVTR